MGSILGGVTDVVGGITGKNQANQSAGQAATAAGENQTINTQLLNNLETQQQQYTNDYSQALSPLTSSQLAQGNVAAQNSGTLASTMDQAGLNASSLQNLTGINATGAQQSNLNNLANTSGTNLNGATGTTNSFYQNELTNGINPQYAQNAQNQISQQLSTQLADARNNAAPGQNMNGLTQSLQNNALQSSANLAGNLAGQNQAIMQQGATGLTNNASALDTQKQNMLGTAATDASAINQQAFQNLGTSEQSNANIISALQSFLGQGQGAVANAGNSLAGLTGANSNLYNSMTQQANSQNASAGSSLGSGLGTIASLAGLAGK